MMYDFKIEAADKATMYRDLASALTGLVEGEHDPIANMANAAALIGNVAGPQLAGFYRNVGGELVVGTVPGTAGVHPNRVRRRRVRAAAASLQVQRSTTSTRSPAISPATPPRSASWCTIVRNGELIACSPR